MTLAGNNVLQDIISGCVNGNRKSQHQLYKLFYGKMMSVCMRYTKDREEARDVLQEGFIKVYGNIGKYNGGGSFEGWVRRIIVNTAIDHFRKNQNSNVTFDSDYVDHSEQTDEHNEENLFSKKISTTEIMNAIQDLSPAYRTVFNLYVMEGYNHREIAEILKISEGTSKSNLAKARNNLKSALGKVMEKQ